MAAQKLNFELVSPARLLLSEQVDMVTLPGSEGEMGVMAAHAPLVTTLKPGILTVTGGGKGDQRIFVRGGFAEVNANGLTVLAEEAIEVASLDRAALESRITAANDALGAAVTDAQRHDAQEALDRLKELLAAVA